MPFDHESLVGHLYIVNGRALSMMPPGALVEVAPKKAARGREADTFYTLVLPSGDALGPAAFYEQMAQLAADTYFTSTGSVTAGLRAVLDMLNQNLTQHNKSGKKRYEASMVIAALRGNDLYVGKVGSAVAALRHAGSLVTYPEDLSDDDALFRPPLGVHAVPDVKMTRYNIANGSRFLLADANLADVERATLETILNAPDLGAALIALKENAPKEIMALAVEFVPPDNAAGASTESPAVAAPLSAASPPVAAPLAGASVSATQPAAAPVNVAVAEIAPPIIREGESTTAIAAAARPPKPAPEAPPPPSDPAERRKRRREERTSRIVQQAQETSGEAALKTADAVDKGKQVFEHYFPSDADGKPRRSFLSSPAAGLLALLIPVIVVGVVLLMWLSGTGESEFELCVGEALESADTARSISSSDPVGYRAAWNAVLTVVERCDMLREGDPTLGNLRVEGQQVIDRLDYVTRQEPSRINSYPQATLTDIVIQGLELYVLDEANDLVYRQALNSDGRSPSNPNPQAIPGMRAGATVNGFTIGELIDIAWAEVGGGVSSGRVITALDVNGTLIACTPRFMECSARALVGFEDIGQPIAMQFWDNGALYLLDPEEDQIWRYDATSGVYLNPPAEYFTRDRPDLINAVDFAIDGNGTLFVLFADGAIQRYYSGQAQSFIYGGFPNNNEVPSGMNGMYLSTDPMGQGIYIVNRERRTIYETGAAGTFFASYRTFNEEQFQLLGGVAADIGMDTIYVTSGNSIFAVPRASGR